MVCMDEHLKLDPQELADFEAKYTRELEDSDSDDDSDLSDHTNATEGCTSYVSYHKIPAICAALIRHRASPALLESI
jgi:uncharacterized protein YeaO (DUF488 family)